MKKITCLLFVSFLFFNCSKPDEPTDNANNPVNAKSSISFTMNNAEYEQDFTAIKIKDFVSDVNWEKQGITTTNLNEFIIDANPKVKGKASDFTEIFSLTIRTTDNTLIVNKTYNLYTGYIESFQLPLNDQTLCYKDAELYYTKNTLGTVKITSFDGKTLKGEFNLSNLSNKSDYAPLGYCNGTQIVEKIFNITNGTFTAIPY